MLRRFADARLRRVLAYEVNRRERAEDNARRIDGLLRQKTAESATNYALAQRWKSIAQQAQTDLAEERAEHQATGRLLEGAQQQAEQACPNCAPGYDCERGIYTPETQP